MRNKVIMTILILISLLSVILVFRLNEPKDKISLVNTMTVVGYLSFGIQEKKSAEDRGIIIAIISIAIIEAIVTMTGFRIM